MGSIAQQTYQMGYYAVEQAVFALEGETVTRDCVIDGIRWNKENMQEYIDSVWFINKAKACI